MKSNASITSGLLIFLFFSSLFTGFALAQNKSDGNTQGAFEKSSLKDSILVFAAASLTDAVTKVNKEFNREYGNVDIKVNFSSSGALRRQIEMGVMPDMYMSANLRQVEILIKKNIIKKSSCSDFVTNGLAIVGPADSKEKIKTIGDLVNVKGRISIGMPEHCPVGTYAKEALESAGIFDRIQSRIVYADTVRQIVRYAQTGNITAGFVYTSDAMLFKDQIRLFCLVDSSLHRPVKYAVVVPAEKKRKALDLYFDFIYSERGMKILSDFGFFQDKSN